jgi:hypothetical protein
LIQGAEMPPKEEKMNCKKEQKIAYNFLFRDCHINEMPLDRMIKQIDKYYTEQLKAFNIELIKQCITKNYESYKAKPFIAWSYSEIAEKLPL